MLNLQIEKEVEGKHGVIKGKDWDIRQTVCLGCAILVTGLCWGMMHLDIIGIIIIGLFCRLVHKGWTENRTNNHKTFSGDSI